YNKTAFYEYVKENAYGWFYAVFVSPKNADYLGRTLSGEAWNSVVNGLIREFHTEFGRENVFHIEGLSFAVITRGDPVKEVAERSFCNSTEETQIYSDFQFCIVSFPEFASYRDKMHEAIDVILDYGENQGAPVAWFKQEDMTRMDREILVLHAVREALREDRFQVYYQPIMEAKTGRFVSAEALIRLNDPKLGFISPEEFIPIAERNGLIIPIGERVFDSVCGFWSKDNLADYGVSFIEINLSTLQCMQKDLASRLMRIMQRHGIETKHVNLEITETAAASNREIMLKNMAALIGLGTAFSLDDYGTGYSNVDYLATLPLEIVKIDKSILWKAMENENSRTILCYTLGMIHDLGLKSVAEGVETQKMVDVLSAAGCDYYQGFLYSRPLPAEEYLEFIKSHGV
ncbi:MAG: EAL domain-containing protein, partial [Clostridia bacterium]|nr:EAL domain-containing protein [Clostridia bacterium]